MTDARSDRLKAALRENLKRRKAQARGRDATRADDPQERAEPEGGGRRNGNDEGG